MPPAAPNSASCCYRRSRHPSPTVGECARGASRGGLPGIPPPTPRRSRSGPDHLGAEQPHSERRRRLWTPTTLGASRSAHHITRG
jgi:hypothetical protein